MHFEERDLKPYSEPLSAADLKEGSIYFSVNYIDETMLVPVLEALVFVGRDLEPDDTGQVYFQDVESYLRGVRYGSTSSDGARFFTGSEQEVSHIFEYETALEELMRCSIRRRQR